ncbi:MAG: hypothetical protein QOF48_524 [Verrucomicrobiota bacterium]
MPKWVKFIIALLLLPLCIGAACALARVVRATSAADHFWVVFIGGAACWLVVFLLLPRPMLIYVFGHELTHALWTWMFGGRVKKFKASARGGQVVVSKSNFLIVLAPYFFPLYAVLVVAAFALFQFVVGGGRHLVWFHLLLGAAYAFHLTLTCHILQTRQTDITSQGWLFSAVIIFLGNITVLLVALPLLTARVQFFTAMAWWLHDSGEVLFRLARIF